MTHRRRAALRLAGALLCGSLFPATLWLGVCAPAAAAAQTSGMPEGTGPGDAQILDRVIAVVRLGSERELGAARSSELITLSDLRFEAAVVLIQRGATRAATETLDGPVLASALDYAIAQRLHTLDADRLNAFQVDAAEVDGALAAFEARFATPGELERFLQRHDADRRRLRQVLERTLRASKILDAKVRLRAQVPDAEVRRYYDAHAAEVDGRPFDEVRVALREKLFRERYQQLVQQETSQLRASADVRIVSPPSAQPAGPPSGGPATGSGGASGAEGDGA